MKRLFLTIAVVLLSQSATSSADVIIVEKGQPRAEIVIAEKPPRMAKLAAEELQAYVEKINGAKLPITTTPGNGIPIYVGKSPHTERMKITDDGLEHGAFRIVATPKAIVLIGRDVDFTPPEPFARHNGDIPRAAAELDKLTGSTWGYPLTQVYKCRHPKLGCWEQDERGSLHAVSELLRRLGVRWFLPGEIGEVLPQKTTISIPVGDETIRPDFALRYPYQTFKRFGMASEDEVLWQLRLGFSQAPEVIGIGELGHGTSHVHARQEIRDAHPDWFLLSGGKRETVGSFGGGKPCLSSPGLFAENVKFVRAMFDIYREPMVSVMPEDGYVSLCQCDLCQGKGTPEQGWNGQISDYVWDYVNRVGQELMKSHPDRKIICFAYGGYQSPPLKIEKLSPNIVVGITQARSQFYDEKERKLHHNLRAAWRKKSSQPLVIWDYYLDPRPGHPHEFLPTFFPHQIAEDVKSLKGISYGDFIEVYRDWEGMKTLAANHLNLYVHSRVWWDADQDLEPLLDDYFSKFYGPADDEMRAFVAHAEANSMFMRKQPEKIDESFALLAEARAKAPPDSVYARRIGLIADYIVPMLQLRDQLNRKRENVPHVQILTNEGPDIVIDGKLDEEVWQRPGGWGLAELETGRVPHLGTSFKVFWQRDSLILCVWCRERDMERLEEETKTDDDASIWNGDVVELLIETQVNSYYQIAINPLGTVTDLDRRDGKLNTLWKSGIQVATQRGEDHWTIEIRLPLAGEEQRELNPLDGLAGRMPSVTYPWHFNVCRQRIGAHGTELSALSPTGENNFHAVDKFAILNLKAGGPNQENPSLNPDRREGYVLQREDVVQLLRKGNNEEGLAALEKLAETKLTDLQQADVFMLAADTARRLKRPEDAMTFAKRIKLSEYNKLAQVRLLDDSRQWQELTAQFADEDLSRWPDPIVGDGGFVRGMAWRHIKDGPRAERDLVLAESFATEQNLRGEILLNLGGTYRELLKDDAKAIAAYRRVYDTTNEFKHCTAAVSVAGILRSQGKTAEARAELARIDEAKMTIPYYRDMLRQAKDEAAK